MIDEGRLYKALGERIRLQREGAAGSRKKLTQAELAQEVGLERTSITNIERGNQKVPLHVLYRICDALQVPVEAVLPPLPDITAAAASPSLDSLFEAQAHDVPPLVKQKLAALLGNLGDSDERRK
jgi:transcriptional regulator with XRE-family HTH domain